jgi:hypothetical protein
MLENRQLRRGLIKPGALICALLIALSGCTVYTIDKSHLEDKLKPRDGCCSVGGLNKLLAMYRYQYNNHVDTLVYQDKLGTQKWKKLRYDSKITVITHDNRSFRLYAKTLYIWKDEFLIGERTSPSLRSPNYFPIKLKDIARIEVKG